MSDARFRLPRSRTTFGLALSIALIVAACSGAGSPAATAGPSVTSAPGAPSQPGASTVAPAGSVCDDLDALKASITVLSQVDLTAGDTEALTAAVGEVQAAAEVLKASASAELATAVDAFTTQIDALQTAVGQLAQGDPGSGLVAVGTAFAGMASAAQALEAEFQAACP